MASGDTPKKPVKRGRPISKAANDCCRLCSCKLKLQFGDFQKASYISTENLFKPSKREECRLDETLAELSSQIGLHISNSPDLSDRVCKSCGRKIRTAFQLYTRFLKIYQVTHFFWLIRQVKIRIDSRVFFRRQFRRLIAVLGQKKVLKDRLILLLQIAELCRLF